MSAFTIEMPNRSATDDAIRAELRRMYHTQPSLLDPSRDTVWVKYADGSPEIVRTPQSLIDAADPGPERTPVSKPTRLRKQ